MDKIRATFYINSTSKKRAVKTLINEIPSLTINGINRIVETTTYSEKEGR
jgi:hypothetical protein